MIVFLFHGKRIRSRYRIEEITEREADGGPRRRKKLVLSGDPFLGGPKETETYFYFPL